MAWKEIYRDMAFSPYKEDMASALELRDSVRTLYWFIQGQSRSYEVLDALRHIEYVCCSNQIRKAASRFRSCLHWEDETAREEVCKESLGAIVEHLDRNVGRGL